LDKVTNLKKTLQSCENGSIGSTLFFSSLNENLGKFRNVICKVANKNFKIEPPKQKNGALSITLFSLGLKLYLG